MKLTTLTWVASVTLSLVAAVASAQESGRVLEEVVVTAQKRTELAQTTPISMEVYGAEEISRKGITDIQALAINDTSLNFSSGGSEGWLTMRGISSRDVTEIGDPTVPVAQDGFFTNRPAQLINAMYDLERIEVLRGPQGTLYGRNATGGVVNIIVAKPTNELEATGSVEIGNYNALNFGGMLNLPLTDRLQLRGSFVSREHDGYRRTQQPLGAASSRGDDEDTQSGRILLAWQPTDSIEALFTYQNTRIDGVGVVAVNIPFIPDPTTPGDILHTMPDRGDPMSFPLGGPTDLDISDETYKLELQISDLPGDLVLTYLGGYNDFEWHQALPTPNLLTPPGVPNSFFQNEYPKTQNHELRLTSPADAVFSWQAGVYYFEEKSTHLFSQSVADPGSSNATAILDFYFPLVETTSAAVFGQGSFNFTDEVKLTVGARYTEDEKERTGVFSIPLFGISGIPQDGSADFSKTTGHVGLDWTPNDQNFWYVKADTGYKAGGFTTCNPYDAEEVTTYEIGTKNRLRGDSVAFDVAAFYNDYENQQVQTFVSPDVCVTNSTVQNAGSSEIYGVEAAVDILLGATRFDVSMTWLDAEYKDFIAAPGLSAAVADCSRPDPLGNCQLAGNTLSQAPEFTVAGGVEHTWDLSEGLSVTGRVEGKYQTKQYYEPFNYGSATQDAYGVVNAYLDFVRDNWRISLWGRNLADEVYLLSAQEFYTIGTYQYSYGPPRTYGVRFEVSLP